MTLRARAQQAYSNFLEDVAQREREERLKLRKAIARQAANVLGVDAEDVEWLDEDGLDFTIEDLKFRGIRTHFYDIALHLWGTCPHCSRPALSDPIRSLIDLGRELTEFRPSHNLHFCPTQKGVPQQKDLCEELAGVLRELLEL